MEETASLDKDYVFWGASGQAKVLRELISHHGGRLLALFDNNPEIRSPFEDVPLFHGEQGFEHWISTIETPRRVHFHVAIGGGKGPDRVERFRYLSGRGLRSEVAAHPAAHAAGDAVLGKGTQVLAGAVVCTGVRAGICGIFNTNCAVEHDCVLGDGVHVAPGATILGETVVGDHAFIGAGSVILPRLSIGANAVIGAGSVVTKDVPDSQTWVGNPARPLTDTRTRT